jgi:peptidoglycan/LPS O-acetylase OafA/YrhL
MKIGNLRFQILKKNFSRKAEKSTAPQNLQVARKSEIDGFRAISVVLVVLSHLKIAGIPGQTGVLFFFVISGYVITLSILRETRRTGTFSLSKFYKRRILKIVPPLFLIILLPSLILVDQLDLSKLTSQVLFYFNWQYLESFSSGVLIGSQVVWSLSVEEQYYITIAVIVFCYMKFAKAKFESYLKVTYFTIVLGSILSRVVIFINTDSRNEFGDVTRILYGTDTRISSIAMGGLVAFYIKTKGSDINNRIGFQFRKFLFHTFVLASLVFSFLFRDEFFRNTLKYTLQECACVALIVMVSNSSYGYSLVFKFLNSRLLQIIGISSYSIYLSHLVLIEHLQKNYSFFNLGNNGVFEKAILICLILIVGIFCHRVADHPFEKMRRNLH